MKTNYFYQLSPNIEIKRIDGLIYLGRKNSDELYLFKGIGQMVFSMILEGYSNDEIINNICLSYPNESDCECDTRTFIQELIDENIIICSKGNIV